MNRIETATTADAGKLVPLSVASASMPVACTVALTVAVVLAGAEVGAGAAYLVHHFGYRAQDDAVVPGQTLTSGMSVGDLLRMRQDELAGS